MWMSRQVLIAALICGALTASAQPDSFDKALIEARSTLVAKYGQGELPRIDRGLRQVRKMWRPGDGGPALLLEFVTTEFLPGGALLDETFRRLEFVLERTDGYLNSLSRDVRRNLDLELGPVLPIDHRLGEFDPSSHVEEDLFKSKVAFVALLNFRGTTLDERSQEGARWSRREWAEGRLAGRFTSRSSPEDGQKLLRAYTAASTYIATYNIFSYHILTRDGKRLFPAGQRLLSHWHLRDEIKACYGTVNGYEKQRLLAKVMDAIVQQSIPRAVINNPRLDWTPETGQVQASSVRDVNPPEKATGSPAKDREPDTRYQKWLDVFRAEKAFDRQDAFYPTIFSRRYEQERELSEAEITQLLESVLNARATSPVAKVVKDRLGRKLEDFDIYYSGFAAQPRADYAELNQILQRRYPSAKEFGADLPRILQVFGFSKERARHLADQVVVEPARGPGHALGMLRRDDKAHLRTRFEANGMDYKGFNIAIHELGHNIEQIFSTIMIDHSSLRGVPNVAFTEALAFLFQARDLAVIDMSATGDSKTRALHEFWETRQVAGAALVDMRAWRWLDNNPNANAGQFRKAVVRIAREVWNQYFAPSFGVRDSTILGIYSHMIESGLYLPDYPLARLIAFQIERHFEKGMAFGPEFERVCLLGYLTPNEWMRRAVGAPLSATPLLDAVDDELKRETSAKG